MKGKLLRYFYKNKESIGFLDDENIITPLDIDSDMNNLILNYEKLHKCVSNERVSLDDVEILSPIKSPLQDVICLGINYMEHARESMRFKKEVFDDKRDEAIYFSKRINAFNKHKGSFHIRNLTNALDYEAELVVIIGENCANVSKENALDYVFGYTISDDISARDIQLKHKQWYGGKSLEGSCPLGPCIVLRDSIDASRLSIKCYVNGELRQNSNTSELIFDIPYAISELSSYFTLKAGSIISMGTPSGSGMGFCPPKFLKVGDEITCEIEGIGKLTTYIKA